MGSSVTMALVVFYLGGFVLQKSSHATLQLQFNFKGVETGKFPNGSNFSPLELISTPVLTQVYQQFQNTHQLVYRPVLGSWKFRQSPIHSD